MIAFKNATLLCGEELEAVEGYVVVEEGIIKEIGEGRCPIKRAADLKRGIVFPAFTNAHTHLGDAVAQDLGVYEEIEKRVGPKGLKFSALEDKKRELPAGMRWATRELLNSGTTAFCDFREGGIEGVELLRSSMNNVTDAVILGRPNGDDINALLKVCHGIGISSVADYSIEELKDIRRVVKKRGKLLGMHVAEVEDDVEAAVKLKPSFMVHLTNAGEESLRVIQDGDIPLVLCPRANAMLGIGVPKIKDLMMENLVALGTDNAMINSLSMFRETEFAFKIARGLSRDPSIDGRDVLRAATLNGRRILGLGSNAIEEGNEANFIILGRRKYLYDPVVAIIHRYDAGDIRGVVKGKRVLRLR
jgi:cytosine/adenosine deaminase-related metal-dependent hydrolase